MGRKSCPYPGPETPTPTLGAEGKRGTWSLGSPGRLGRGEGVRDLGGHVRSYSKGDGRTLRLGAGGVALSHCFLRSSLPPSSAVN